MPKIKERLNQQTTKLGIISALIGLGIFPDDVNVPLLISTANDWIDASLNLYHMVGVQGAAAAVVIAVALRWIGVNRDRV